MYCIADGDSECYRLLISNGCETKKLSFHIFEESIALMAYKHD